MPNRYAHAARASTPHQASHDPVCPLPTDQIAAEQRRRNTTPLIWGPRARVAQGARNWDHVKGRQSEQDHARSTLSKIETSESPPTRMKKLGRRFGWRISVPAALRAIPRGANQAG